MKTPKKPIVSIEWLAKNIDTENLVVLDSTLFKNKTDRDITATPSIPTARYFDLKNDFSDRQSVFPNTIPTKEKFAESCSKLGIANDSLIVIYDQKGIYSSARAWYLFKIMGHQHVFVLNGGFPAWQNFGLPTGLLNHNLGTKTDYKAQFSQNNILTYEDIVEHKPHSNQCIIDARSEGRFKGVEVEPRPELQSGSIPNSFNLPYTEVLENGYFKSSKKLHQLFNSLDLDEKKLVFTCGSGVTACILLLASELVLENPKSIYDGSWTEYATKQQLFTTKKSPN